MTSKSTKLYDKVLGCLLGGEIGDAMGAPAEGKTYQEIAEKFGTLTDFTGFGTDDSALKHILCDAITASEGYPTADDWAKQWMIQEDMFIKRHLFWIPVMNGFWKIRAEGVSPRQAGRGNMASSSSAMCISPMGIINAGNPRQAALETYDIASPIHHNFCRDAACSMAAAVAAALHPDATVIFGAGQRCRLSTGNQRYDYAKIHQKDPRPGARNGRLHDHSAPVITPITCCRE